MWDTSELHRLFVLATLLVGHSCWKCQLLAGTVTHVAVEVYLGAQGTPRGRARLGQACADPDPAIQEPGVQLWFGFHSHPAHSVFVSQETPVLGRTCAALLTVVQQVCSVWYNRKGWVCYDSGKWPKLDSPAWDNGCRLLLTYHKRVSF